MNKIILDTSEEAAQYRTVTGWVSSNGNFYGEDERLARYSGSTHHKCKTCDNIVEKFWIICEECRDKKEIERYNSLERKEWDGGIPLYSYNNDVYFDNYDDLIEYLEEYDSTVESLRLVLCKPIRLNTIDEDYFCDSLVEDDELSNDIITALDALNDAILKEPPVSWEPDKYAAIVDV